MIDLFQDLATDLLLDGHDILNLKQKPGIDLRNVGQFLHGRSQFECVSDLKRTVPVGFFQPITNFKPGGLITISAKSVIPVFKALPRFLEAFRERASDCHNLTDGLHLGSQFFVYTFEFFKIESWDLGHHVINGRLKARRCGTGHVVFQFVQRVSNSQLRCHLCDRIARGLRRQRR